MTLLCMEGFDHFDESQVTRKKMSQASLSAFVTGRFGSGNAVYLMASLNDWIQKDIGVNRSEEHTSELQSHSDLVCRLLLEKKKQK